MTTEIDKLLAARRQAMTDAPTYADAVRIEQQFEKRLGFAFREGEVLLIEKKRPDWQEWYRWEIGR